MGSVAVSEIAPTLEDARRAARELVDAGVGMVLLYGSVARGDATAHSDIDLVAVFDDLGDYRCRSRVRCDLGLRAGRVAGWPVDVFVTDLPEWTTRTQKVGCSFEAGIAPTAVRLADSSNRGTVYWDKEIGMPDTPHAEMESRFKELTKAVGNLDLNLKPTAKERQAARADNVIQQTRMELDRFGRACGSVHQTFEAAAKLMMIITTGEPAPNTHLLDKLLKPQPGWVVEAFEWAARNIDLVRLPEWHQGAIYSGAQPVEGFDDAYLEAHAEAAVEIARFAGEQGRQHGVAPNLLEALNYELQSCENALEQPRRIPTQPPKDGLRWGDLLGPGY